MCGQIWQVASATWKTIRTEMDDLDVGILINNVGCSYDHYEYLHIITDETVDQLVEINIRATTQVRLLCCFSKKG